MPSVDGTEITGLVGPLIPYADTVLLEIMDIGVAGEKPQKLMNYRLQVQLLGREHGKAMRQVHAHLMPEDGERASTGPVALASAVIKHTA